VLNKPVKLCLVAEAPTGRTTQTPRTGRRRGESSTRQAILDAAKELFAERGYAGATMRAIAAEAGVDAALVVHFFGNKANLLVEAVEWPFDPEIAMPVLLADGRRNVGRKLVTLFVTVWDHEGSRNPIVTLLRAATTEPQAAERLNDFLTKKMFAPLMDRLNVDRPELRANLVASQMVGVGITRYIVRLEPIASAKPEEVVDLIAPTIQRYLTGKLDA
jgi:AcrR family transcriptional regulator